MGVTDKLVNATPFDVNIPYDRGVSLKVPSDGQIQLTYDQLQDFRPGTEGYEEIRNLLESNGLFILDPDKSYDVQALDCLRACLRHKETQYTAFVDSVQNARLSQNKSIDEDSMQKIVDQAGYGKQAPNGVQWQIDKLQGRIRILEETGEKQAARAGFDPKRTCFGTQPPREFPSETALKMFLEENPELKAQQEKYIAALEDTNE